MAVAKYKEVADILLKEIEDGIYNQTGKLPTEEQLVAKFNVSKSTIRNAIQVLCQYGKTYQVHGLGVYIREDARHGLFHLPLKKGLAAQFPNKKVESRCLKLEEIKADDYLAEQFKCAVGTPIYAIERLRIVDGLPYCFEHTYFNKELIPYLNTGIMEGSVYTYIEDVLKLKIAFIDKYISADQLSAWDAQVLELNPGDPCLIIKDIGHLSNGTIFNHAVIYYNYKQAVLFATAGTS